MTIEEEEYERWGGYGLEEMQFRADGENYSAARQEARERMEEAQAKLDEVTA
jgi:hypothetical protein